MNNHILSVNSGGQGISTGCGIFFSVVIESDLGGIVVVYVVGI